MTSAALAVIRTPRLTLRPLEHSDADAMVAGIGNFDVSRWLSVVPYPYGKSDADAFIKRVLSEDRNVWAICDDEGLQGVIGIEDELGYWLARPVWRRGYAFEAAQAIVTHWFSDPQRDDLVSGYFVGNDKSVAILSALGFRTSAQIRRNAKALSQDVDAFEMILTRARWNQTGSFELYTPRLTIQPLVPSDATELHGLVTPDVARQTASIPLEWSVQDAGDFITQRLWCGLPGFMLAVRCGGRMVGCVGCGAAPVSLMYMFDKRDWGQGFATEAVSAFLPEIFARFPVNGLAATCFEDNAASCRVLDKMGFHKVGTESGGSLARLEPAPVVKYRLNRNDLRIPV